VRPPVPALLVLVPVPAMLSLCLPCVRLRLPLSVTVARMTGLLHPAAAFGLRPSSPM